MKKTKLSLFCWKKPTMLLFCFMLGTFCLMPPVMAQFTLTPAANPLLVRYQKTCFHVDVENNSGAAISDYTLSITPSAGFTFDYDETAPIALNSGASTRICVYVIATCTAPQTGGVISYTLLDGSGVTEATASTTSISLSEPDFIFTRAADFQADYVSSTKPYTRIWAITQSATGVFVQRVQVQNLCNENVVKITKVELVDDATGTNVLADLTATHFDDTQSGKYLYTFGGTIFQQIGNNDGNFDTDETIYIRET
jgi:hypothetical protein